MNSNNGIDLARRTARLRIFSVAGAFCTLLQASPAVAAQQEPGFEDWQLNRELMRRGQQAVLICNGLFTSNRPDRS